MLRKILIFLLVVLVVIQFFHPKKNKATGDQPNYIGKVYPVPDDVKSILEKACNDCHSNNTRYPWYCSFQPFDWWTDKHVRDGIRHLNLDDFTSKSPRFQYNKLGDIKEQIQKGEMPISSYLWIHKDAILTDVEKKLLINWSDSLKAIMKTKYPMDSLIRKKRG